MPRTLEELHMPEYLAPGVFVEEVSFRSKSIEGVPTSTTGFAGMAHYGPICYPGSPTKTPKAPKSCLPRLVTSFVEFERIYGGLEPLAVGADVASEDARLPYLAHAARAFFDNGGKRLYVARVFAPRALPATPADFDEWGLAARSVPAAGTTATWWARWPGKAGNVRVLTKVLRSKNIAVPSADGTTATVPRARPGMVVEVYDGTQPPPVPIPVGNQPLDEMHLRVARANAMGAIELVGSNGMAQPLLATDVVQLVELVVEVTVSKERFDRYGELAASPLQKRNITRILEKDDPEDEDAVVWLEFDSLAAESAGTAKDFIPAALMLGLQADANELFDRRARRQRGRAGRSGRPRGRSGRCRSAGDRPGGAGRHRRHRDRGGARRRRLRRGARPPGGGPADQPRRAAALPDRDRRRAGGQLDDRDPRFPRHVRLPPTALCTTPGSRSSIPPKGRPRARRRAGCSCRRRVSWRASTRAPTSPAGAQGAGQRGGARPDPFRGNINKPRQEVLNPEGHQRAAFLRRARLPGVGRAHHEARIRNGNT